MPTKAELEEKISKLQEECGQWQNEAEQGYEINGNLKDRIKFLEQVREISGLRLSRLHRMLNDALEIHRLEAVHVKLCNDCGEKPVFYGCKTEPSSKSENHAKVIKMKWRVDVDKDESEWLETL